MNLTKEQAIQGHRKMWGWIADRIEETKSLFVIVSLKYMYCKQHSLHLFGNCFCCEYNCIENNSLDCSKCPLEWGSDLKECMCLDKNKEDDFKGLYSLCEKAKTWQEQVELARKIANLPVKEV